MKKYNYHTHTYRCGHAVGNEEDMVKAAIKMNIEELGICCHIPFPHYRLHLLKSIPSIRGLHSLLSLGKTLITNGPNMRMPYKQLDDYLQAIDMCQQKYGQQINIYKGFEAEGLEEYFSHYQSLLDHHQVDYLILGHHFHKHCIHNDYYGRKKLTKKDIYQYCNDVEKALETNLFSYLAHPDLFLIGYKSYDIDMETVSRRICEKAKACHIPLELNAGGIRRGLKQVGEEQLYLYPNPHFWKIASEVGNDVVIGFDAHQVEDMNDQMYSQLINMAEEYHLHLIDEFEFKKGNA